MSRYAPFVDLAANQWLPNDGTETVPDRRLRMWLNRAQYAEDHTGALTGLATIVGWPDTKHGPDFRRRPTGALVPAGAVPPRPGQVSPEAYVAPEAVVVTNHCRGQASEDAAISVGMSPTPAGCVSRSPCDAPRSPR